jgi:hypothetical protein
LSSVAIFSSVLPGQCTPNSYYYDNLTNQKAALDQAAIPCYNTTT